MAHHPTGTPRLLVLKPPQPVFNHAHNTHVPGVHEKMSRAREKKKTHTRDTCHDGCLAYRKKNISS
jgi:hypothetical protein